MKRRSIVVSALIAFGIMSVPSAYGAETIKFAMAAPMTGDSAAMGIQIRKGAEMAVEEINAAGGVQGKKLEMVVFDDMANPQQASLVAEKIAADKDILFVLGHNNSGCSLAALPTYQKVNLPIISPTNTAPSLTTMGYKNYFRTCPDDSLLCVQMALMGITEKGLKKPAIVWENTDYGKSLRDLMVDALTAKGIKVVGDESYVAGVDRDYSAQITKFKGAGADSVYFMGEYTATALFLKQSKSLGFQAQGLGSSGNSSPKLMEIAGPAADGTFIVAMFDPNDPRPKTAAFIQKYLAKNGERPGEWGSNAYDIVYLVKAAMGKGAKDRASLIETLHSLKGFEGVTGKIEFDAKGDVPGKKMSVLRIQGGKFVNYVPTKY